MTWMKLNRKVVEAKGRHKRASKEFINLQSLFEELGYGGKKEKLLVMCDPGKKKFSNLLFIIELLHRVNFFLSNP